ncbi:MAG: class I SAM-dependent methyltransferase [Microlunatus sp.]|nr:class I SAM-dependent methyltransferase [Microlunatus sp.]
MTEHYFSDNPAGSERRKEVAVELFGRQVTVLTANGVFAGHGLDKGTAVLLKTVPPPTGRPRILDLGCGWGPIALGLALASPGAVVDAVDVNDRSLSLCRDNAARLGVADRVCPGRPADVPADRAFDQIWSNPPIRIGKAALHDLLLRWLGRLTPGGVAHLVVGKNLGADTLANWLIDQGYRCQRAGSAKGFRVLTVRGTDQSLP